MKFKKAACLLEQGQNVQAHEVCNLAIQVDPSAAKAFFRRGLAQYRLTKVYEARSDFQKAVDLIDSKTATPVLFFQ